MKPYRLFLDDMRRPEDAFVPGVRTKDIGIVSTTSLLDLTGTIPVDWVVVRNYDEFEFMLRSAGIPSMVSFDHDLHLEHIRHYFNDTINSGIVEYGNLKNKTGLACAQLLIDMCITNNTEKTQFPKWYVHSANEWGGANISTLLNSYKV